MLRLLDGDVLRGPVDINKGGDVTIHLDAGFTLKGPITIMICDAAVEIGE
jgi:hypothetical protein